MGDNNTSTGNVFKCVDTARGNYCPSFPKLLPKGDNSGKFSSSGMYDEEYFIDGTGRLYYSVLGAITLKLARNVDFGR